MTDEPDMRRQPMRTIFIFARRAGRHSGDAFAIHPSARTGAITLDGAFTVEQLEVIVSVMRQQQLGAP